MTKEVKQFVPKTALENWEYNMKRPKPENYDIAFIDGNEKNIAFKNLKLVRNDKKAEQAAAAAPEVEVPVEKKAEKKESKKSKK